jgi:hypothetical protein
MTNPIVWGAIFTGVIALETLFYVVFTRRLWKQTKAAAEAAKLSAEAAKQSTDIVAKLHRPFLGVTKISSTGSPTIAPAWINWTLKNYGTLPATNVDATFEWKAGVVSSGGEVGPSAAEVFPQQEIESTVVCRIAESIRTRLPTGDAILEVNVRIKYSAADGRSFVYNAHGQWKHETGGFSILRSQTEQTH